MSDSLFDFEDLIRPSDSATFLNHYWEQQPFALARNNPDFYSDLFSTENLDSLIRYANLKYPEIQLAKNGAEFSINTLEGMNAIAPQEYGVPNPNYLYETYAQGGTILVDRLQEHWGAIAALCRNLERLFHAPVNATAYLVHKDAQGFSPHSHNHSVFILQLEGVELWRVCPTSPDLASGLASGGSDRPGQESPAEEPHPDHEWRLNAGDFLYIPRGCVHQALPSGYSSLHLAIDVHLFTWTDLIANQLASLDTHSIPFHKALPVGFLRQTEIFPSLQTRLTELLNLLTQNAKAEVAIDRLARQFVGSMQPLPDGHFSQLSDLDQIDLDTVVIKRSSMICWFFQAENHVGIQFPGNQITGPIYIAPALRFIMQADEFRVRELPNSLSDRSKLVLIRRLIKDGLLKVVSHETAAIMAESTLEAIYF